MTKTDKLLRSLVPQEVVALLEKIDATDSTSDSSYRGAQTLLRDGNFNWLERKLIKHAISKISRRETLSWAMNVVVFNNINGEVAQPHGWLSGHGPISGAASNSKPNPTNMDTLLAQSAQQAWMRQIEANQAQQSQYRNMYGSRL